MTEDEVMDVAIDALLGEAAYPPRECVWSTMMALALAFPDGFILPQAQWLMVLRAVREGNDRISGLGVPGVTTTLHCFGVVVECGP